MMDCDTNKKNISYLLMTLSLIGFIICIGISLHSATFSQESYPHTLYIITFAGLLVIIGGGRLLYPQNKGLQKYSRKMWGPAILAKCPMWLKYIVYGYVGVLGIVAIVVSNLQIVGNPIFLLISVFYLHLFAQLYGDHTNPHGQKPRNKRRLHKPKPQQNNSK